MIAPSWNDVGDVAGSHTATALFKPCNALAALGFGINKVVKFVLLVPFGFINPATVATADF